MSSISLYAKFKVHTLFGIFFFGEMIFVDLKGFGSIISVQNCTTDQIVCCGPVQLVSQEKNGYFLEPSCYTFIISFIIFFEFPIRTVS